MMFLALVRLVPSCRSRICDIWRLLALGVFIASAPPAIAAKIIHAEATLVEDNYEVYFAVILKGEFARLQEIVTDYPKYSSISPTVTSSRVISGKSGEKARIELMFRPCVFVIFCKTVKKVSDTLIEDGGARVRFQGVPELSDFHEARETVTLVDEPGSKVPSVRFVYSAVLRPKFFVPPLIGPWLIRRYIVNDLKTTSARTEQILQRGAIAGE